MGPNDPNSSSQQPFSASNVHEMNIITKPFELFEEDHSVAAASGVKALLGLDKLTGSTFTSAKNFKLYDDYVSAEVKVWASRENEPSI